MKKQNYNLKTQYKRVLELGLILSLLLHIALMQGYKKLEVELAHEAIEKRLSEAMQMHRFGSF